MAGKDRRRVTQVINIREAPKGWRTDPQYVYIGRAGKGLTGEWGNPIRLTEDTFDSRVRVIREYLRWVMAQPSGFRLKIKRELRGKTLVCFCAPKWCHGEVLAFFADKDD